MQELPYKLSVLGWSSHAPGLLTREDWRQWAQNGTISEEAGGKLELPQIPAMLRRRLSPMGKSALWCCYQVVDDFDAAPPTIFCSQHGEVAETVKLLKELALEQPLSPTAFSLSVHNAMAGIHSIARGVTQNLNAIAAGPDSWCAAILDAYSLLHSNADTDRVLCVLYDSPLPDDYGVSKDSLPFPVSAAILLGRHDNQDAKLNVSFELTTNTDDRESPLPMLDFVRLLVEGEDGEATLAIHSDLRHWQWRAQTVTQ